MPALLVTSAALLVLELTRTDETAAEQGSFIQATSSQVSALAAPLAPADGPEVAENGASAEDAAAQPPEAKKKPKKKKKRPPLPEVEGTVSINAVGDVVMGSRMYGFAPGGSRELFDGVESMFTGDLVLGNLEGTLATSGASRCSPEADNCFAFRSSPDEARWLVRAGFTTLNLANNHTGDFGQGALLETRAALKQRRLDHTGAPGQITVRRIGKIRVAVVGFSPHSGSADMRDIAAAAALVKKATRLGHIVVVTMHAGAEGADRQHVKPGIEYYLGQNRGDPVRFARAVVDAGADLVVGHGPHVLRGMQWYKGRLIAYSMGNFAGYNVFNLAGPSQFSGVLKVTLNADGTWAKGKLAATKLVGRGVPVRDRAEQAHALVRRLSKQDFGRLAVRVNGRGELLRPKR